MKLRQLSQQVFEAIREGGKRSIRKIAEATGIPKSSVHRHQRAIERRNQYPESSLWETAAGQEWLRLLVFGTIYVFGIKCGIGAETLSEFFYLLQLRSAGRGVTRVRYEVWKLWSERPFWNINSNRKKP